MPRQGDPEPHLFEIFEITKILHLISRSIDFRLSQEPGTRVVVDRSILDKEGSVSLQKAKLYKKRQNRLLLNVRTYESRMRRPRLKMTPMPK